MWHTFLNMDYSPCFLPKTDKFDFVKKRIPTERAAQDEQNYTNFSFVAPSSEELYIGYKRDLVYIVMYKLSSCHVPPPLQIVEDLQASLPTQFVQQVFSIDSPLLQLRYTARPKVHTHTTVWWKVLMVFLHNRTAESHEILSECSHQ